MQMDAMMALEAKLSLLAQQAAGAKSCARKNSERVLFKIAVGLASMSYVSNL
jgi:hypothetical protein